MKKCIPVLLFMISVFLQGTAQKIKRFTIMPGENILEVIPKQELYAYESFQKGTIWFKNGAKSTASLNYSFLFEEFHFINSKGDTLAIVNPGEVKTAVIGQDSFYYAGNRFVKKDTAIGEMILSTAAFFATTDRRKIGAYGTTTDGGTDSYTSFDSPTNGRLELTPQIITVLTRTRAMFMGDKFNRFLPVNKKNIFSFYPEKEQQLIRYLQKNNVNFFSRRDIIDLIIFMSKV